MKDLTVDIKQQPNSSRRLGVVAIVVAEWHPTDEEDEYSSRSVAITQKALDQISKDAKASALRTGADLQATEIRMCRTFQDALVDNVVETLLDERREKGLACDLPGEEENEDVQDNHSAGDRTDDKEQGT